MSSRERALATVSISVLVLLALDQYALSPLLAQQDQLQVEREQILGDVARAQKINQERKKLAERWKSMIAGGLSKDPATAEGQILHALRDYARDAGLSLASLKPERPESKGRLKEILVQTTATGNMESVTRFLLKLQSASFPLKVTEFQLSTRTDGKDDLNFQLKVSTLFDGGEKTDKPAEKKVALLGSARGGSE
ncbi:MAG TPA: type 4a pilus biogenesis protein PilO [Planctomycetota bacterium]|nr:type 4a pilus biogenesis protein PilO [Planctomycetota bacterium]